MVKSEIIKKETDIKFPCLMQDSHVVALMNSREEGVVVHRLSDVAGDTGTVMKISMFNNFKLFSGTITLSNS